MFSIKTPKQRKISKERECPVWTSDLGPLKSAAKPPLISNKSGFQSSPVSELMWKVSTFSGSEAVCTCALCRRSPLTFTHTGSGTASLTHQQPLCQRGLCQAKLRKNVAESCNGKISSMTLTPPSLNSLVIFSPLFIKDKKLQTDLLLPGTE